MSDTATVQVIHLFRPNYLITECCKRPAVDSRLSGDAGTFDPAEANCPGRELMNEETGVAV